MDIQSAAKSAKSASIKLAAISSEQKNRTLSQIARELVSGKEKIFRANDADLESARETRLAAPLLKRLALDDKKLSGIIEGIESLIGLPDPVGVTLGARELDEGLELYQTSCPIGVIGIIFESRPDALVQISTLCLKSGNAVLLKGGSEAARTNRVLADIIIEAAKSTAMPEGWLHLLETRADVDEMLAMDDEIDLLIPRGSNEFVQYIMDNSNIPVMGHADGICHVYVDEHADLSVALEIVEDAKCQYVAVCNAAETLLVHEKVSGKFLPALQRRLSARGVSLRGCPKTRAVIDAAPADENDWRSEYLDLVLSIKVVEDIATAIEHINLYGSGHTDAIVTENEQNAKMFFNLVDSGNVFWNCSTRFSDGFRYGLGAEVGISTSKIHARGPVGLEGLVIYKWLMKGTGQTVAPYADGKRSFTHRKLEKKFSI